MERYLFKYVSQFLEECHVFLCHDQHSLRQKLSSTTQLAEATHYFSQVIDTTSQVDVVVFYFAQAFNQI